MPVRPQALATITVSARNSGGRPGRPLQANARPSARAPDGSCWYGFVFADTSIAAIGVNETATVPIYFLAEEYAERALPLAQPIDFGDGVTVYGTLVIERWLGAN